MKKIISLLLTVILIFSATAVFAAPASTSYSGYAKISGVISANETEVERGDTFRVYFSVEEDSAEIITAFHLLGGFSDNLQIVDSGYLGNADLSQLPDPGSAEDADQMTDSLIFENNGDQIIDFSVAVMKNDNDDAITKNEDTGLFELIWIDFEATSSGNAEIWLDDSYVRTGFENVADNKFCLNADTLEIYVDGSSYNGSGSGSTSSVKRITYFAFENLKPIAKGTIDEASKTVSVTVPKGTDLTNLKPTIRFTGRSVSPRSGEEQDFTNPVVYTVTASNRTTQDYTVTVKEQVDPLVPPVTGSNPFSDIATNDWEYPYVREMYDKGIISGYYKDANGKAVVLPDGYITREEAAKISVGAYGLTLPTTYDIPFADEADIAEWAKPYISAGYNHQNQMVRGYPEDNTFRPKNNMSREELAALIVNTFGFGAATDPDVSGFSDADQITWSAPYVAKAADLGIIVGYEDGSFRPGLAVSRAEAMTMFYRALSIYQNLTN